MSVKRDRAAVGINVTDTLLHRCDRTAAARAWMTAVVLCGWIHTLHVTRALCFCNTDCVIFAKAAAVIDFTQTRENFCGASWSCPNAAAVIGASLHSLESYQIGRYGLEAELRGSLDPDLVAAPVGNEPNLGGARAPIANLAPKLDATRWTRYPEPHSMSAVDRIHEQAPQFARSTQRGDCELAGVDEAWSNSEQIFRVQCGSCSCRAARVHLSSGHLANEAIRRNQTWSGKRWFMAGALA
jgi:hypothetical protein